MIWLGAPSPEPNPAPGDDLFLMLPSFSVLSFNLCHIPGYLALHVKWA